MSESTSLRALFPTETSVPAEYCLGEPVAQTRYLINGVLNDWQGPAEKVFSPVCVLKTQSLERKFLGSYPLLTEAESLEALASAVRAYDNGQGLWPTMSVEERIECVENFVSRMGEKRTEVINLLMWEIGKTLEDSTKEFDRTILYVKDTIDALKELDRRGSRFELDSGILAQIRRAPLGVTLCMGPYNYPLNETYTILIPALLMGNTVIFKPPRMGVLLHAPLLEAFRDSFPPGVVNTVYGEGAQVISPLMKSGQIDCLGFIGSCRVADILKSQHPKPHRLRSILGLGAKNPAIILSDADLKLAVDECTLGGLSYNGQRCTALKIIFVHDSISDEFVGRLSQAVDSLSLGMPWEPKVRITPLPEEGKCDYLAGLVADAIAKGASVVNPHGGEFAETLYKPALVYPVKQGMQLYDVEQFGPVVAVARFSNIEEPIRYIIDSPFGQQLSIFGRDSRQIASLIDPVVNQVCRVNINSQCQRGPDTFPFTGRKDSAEGTLSVTDALRVFSIRTLVAAKLNDLNKDIINDIVRNRRSKFLSNDFIL